MLKVLRLMLDHNIEPDETLIALFRKVERRTPSLPVQQLAASQKQIS